MPYINFLFSYWLQLFIVLRKHNILFGNQVHLDDTASLVHMLILSNFELIVNVDSQGQALSTLSFQIHLFPLIPIKR